MEWVTAAFGLVGVLVGSGITFGIQVYRDRREDRRAKLSATRLVAAEMRHAVAAMQYGRCHHKWWAAPIDLGEWQRQASVLSAVLSREDWLAVRDGYDQLRTTERTRSLRREAGRREMTVHEVSDLFPAEGKVVKAIALLEAHDPPSAEERAALAAQADAAVAAQQGKSER